MRQAINKKTNSSVWIEHKNKADNKHLFTAAKWKWLEEAAKEEWTCPFCGNDMVLRSFREDNAYTPHWTAKNYHDDECSTIEKVMDGDAIVKINYLKNLVNTPKEEYINISAMNLDDFDSEIYTGAVLRVVGEDIEIKRVSEFAGTNWADINIGNPFKKGIAIKIRESEIPGPEDEMIICFDGIRKHEGEGQYGPYVRRYATKYDYKFFIKEREIDLMKHFDIGGIE